MCGWQSRVWVGTEVFYYSHGIPPWQQGGQLGGDALHIPSCVCACVHTPLCVWPCIPAYLDSMK